MSSRLSALDSILCDFAAAWRHGLYILSIIRRDGKRGNADWLAGHVSKYCFNDVLPEWDWNTNRWDRVLVTMD